MSNINPLNINGSYPIAGVDNDSQGFRDNFTNIKNNFTFAQAELNDLQSKVVLKSALTNSTLNNNFAGALMTSAEIRDFRETSFDNGIQSTSAVLDHANGHYQRISTSGSVSISFQNIPPAGKIGRFRLKLSVTSLSHRLIMPAAVNRGQEYINEYNSHDNSIGFSESGVGNYYFEFLTDDAGVTFSVQDLTRAPLQSDYKYANISANNFSVSVSNKLILDTNLVMLDYANISLPAYPQDGQTVTIITKTDVSNVFILANTPAVVSGNVSNLYANSSISYTYVATSVTPTWFNSTAFKGI
jgi:hypothetical protein